MKTHKIFIGTLIGLFAVLVVGLTVYAWQKHQKEERNLAQEQSRQQVQQKTIQSRPVQQKKAQNHENVTIEELMKNAATFKDESLGFMFDYPKIYSMENQNSSMTDRYLLKNNDIPLCLITVTNWKEYKLKEKTPGAEYERIAYNNWIYFSSNLAKFRSGKCDNETASHIPGQALASTSDSCLIDKQDDYLKIEADDSIIVFSDKAEISWKNLNPDNFNLIKEIAKTFSLR